MIAPTPGSAAPETTPVDQDRGPEAAAPGGTAARPIPNWNSPEIRARDFLERLGRSEHPDAERDPISALYQVAVDFRCSAHGYRELYLHRVRHSIPADAPAEVPAKAAPKA